MFVETCFASVSTQDVSAASFYRRERYRIPAFDSALLSPARAIHTPFQAPLLVRYLLHQETAESKVGAGFWASVWSAWLGRRADELATRAFQRVSACLSASLDKTKKRILRRRALPSSYRRRRRLSGCRCSKRKTLQYPPSLVACSSFVASFRSAAHCPLMSVYNVN